MTKWEYLRLSSTSSSSIISGKSFIAIAPSKKVNLDRVLEDNPSAKLENPKDTSEVLKLYPKSSDSLKLYWDVIDYLGSEGWEPFSIEQDSHVHVSTIHFKRARTA